MEISFKVAPNIAAVTGARVWQILDCSYFVNLSKWCYLGTVEPVTPF